MHGVIPTGVEVGGVSGVLVPGEGKQPQKTQGTLHVLALEVKHVNTTLGPKDHLKVQSLWYAHAGGVTGETQEDSQMQERYEYATKVDRRGEMELRLYGREGDVLVEVVTNF